MFDKWDKRFIELARTVGNWSSCYQSNRKIGAVIVRDRRILTTGYNGAPAGVPSCVERGECLRRNLGIASGTRQELCYALHAEQNALIVVSEGLAVQGGRRLVGNHAVLGEPLYIHQEGATKPVADDDAERRVPD